jgi:hypothetical protein
MRRFSMCSPKQRSLLLKVSDSCFLFCFVLLEYDFCLLNWIRIDFTSQIQISKQIVKTIYDSMNHTHIEKEFLPD